MPTQDFAFINAEQRCFDWLKVRLADIDNGGISAYLGEMPISIGNAAYVVPEKQMWMFAITGQTETMTSPIGSPVHCHMATATFKAMLSSRKTALYMLGRLRKIMPAAVADTVQRIAIEPGASIIRDTVELSNDQEAGGLYRVWLIEQPLMIQFSNDDEDISYEGN